MRNIFTHCSTLKKLLFCLVLFTACLNSTVSAQVQRFMANDAQKSSDDYLAIIIKAGYVDQKDNATDGNLQTYANLSSTNVKVLGLTVGGKAVLRLRFTGADKPAIGDPVTVKLGLGGDLLTALGGIKLQAIKGTGNSSGNGNEVGPTYTGSSLVNLISGENQIEFTFTPTVAYDGVKISLGDGTGVLSAGVLSQLKVYGAYFTKPANGIVCETPLDVLYGSTGNIAGGLNAVEDPYNAIDKNDGTRAFLRANVSALNSTYLRAVYPSTSKVGDSVKVILQQQGAGLLDVNLLASNLRLRTFLDQTQKETLALNNALLGLKLLTGSTNKYVLTYPTTLAFNQLQISLGDGLVNALSGLYVYELGRVAPTPIIDQSGLVNGALNVCEGSPVNIAVTNPEAGSTYRWFDAPQGGNEITSGLSNNGATFSPTGLTVGTHDFYVALYRNGCTDPASERDSIKVMINKSGAATDIVADGVSICLGATANLAAPTLTLPGSINLATFTWYFDANKTMPISTGTVGGVTYTINGDNSLKIEGLTASKTYYVSVQGEDVCESPAGALKAVTVTVNSVTTPIIDLAGTQTIGTGGDLILTATSANAVSYQWYKNGILLPGETAAVLTINNVSATDAGSYTVYAFGSTGCTSEQSTAAVISIGGFGTTKTVSGLNLGNKIEAGSELTYTITVNNTGSGALNNITVSDVIPTGTTYVAGSADNGGTLTGNILNWTIDIPIGTQKAVSFKVKVADDLTSIASIGNTATVTDPTDPGNPQTPTVPPVPTDQLRKFSSTKTVSGLNVNSKIEAGSELTYTINVVNEGNVSLDNIAVSDVIPTGTTYVVGSADNGGILTGNTLNWTLATIPVTGNVNITFKVKVADNLTGIASIGNIATVTDPTDPGNPQTPTVPPVPTDPLRKFSSTKTVSGLNVNSKIEAGSELTYTINVVNDGNVSLDNIAVSDVIPIGTSYVAGSADNGGVLIGNTLNWILATIPVTGNTAVTFKVKVVDDLTGIASIGNIATVTDPTDPGNPQTPTVPPVPTDQLRKFSSTKTVSGLNVNSKIEAGSELTYAINVVNDGNVSLDNIAVSDVIPTGTTYVAGSADNGGVLTANTLNWTVDIPVTGNINITFKVKVAYDLTGIASIGNIATVTDPTDPGNPQTPTVPPVPTDQLRKFSSTKTVSGLNVNSEIEAGSELIYTINVVNEGNVSLDNITVSDVIPTGTTYVVGSADNGGTLTGNILNWTLATIPVTGNVSVTFKVKVADDLTGIASIGNIATVTDPTDPGNPQTPTVPPVPTDQTGNFTVSSTVVSSGLNGSANPNDQLTYTITVNNTGNTALINANINDALPAHTSYVSVGNGGTYSSISQNFNFIIPIIPVGGSEMVSFIVKADQNLQGVATIDNEAIVLANAITKNTTAGIAVVCPTKTVELVDVNGETDGNICFPVSGTVIIKASTAGLSHPVYYLYKANVLVESNSTGLFTVSVIAGQSYTYSLAVSADGYCETLAPQRKELIFAISELPTAPDVMANQVVSCGGQPVVLSVANAKAGYTYNWYSTPSGGVLAGSGINFTTPVINTNTSYYVEAVNTTSCVSPTRTEVAVSMGTLPQKPVSLSLNNGPMCSGTGAVLSVDQPDPNLNYEWYTQASGGTSLGSGVTYTTAGLTSSSMFYVESVSKTSGCVSLARTSISVAPLPVLDIPVITVADATINSVTFSWPAVNHASGYEMSMDNGLTWNWAPSTQTSYTATGLKPDQSVTIMARSVGVIGCQNSLSAAPVTGKTTNPLGNQVYIPNAFTPNNDGNNDYFLVYGNTISQIKMRVFTQWGQLIFESRVKENGWDGTFKGQMQPNGVYVYSIDLTFNDGTKTHKDGTVTILR